MNIVNWIDNKKRKPRLGGEYLVVWNLNDNKYPVTAFMSWDGRLKRWEDPLCNDKVRIDEILYWAHLPRPPKGISKLIYKTQEY
jgi:hypothetical protein